MRDCFTPVQAFDFLEDVLSKGERLDFETHLSSCPKCRAAVEERRLFVAAAESLPDLEVPPDFNQRIMDKIAVSKVSLKSWLIAACIWLVSISSVLTIVASSTGEGGTGFLIRLNQWFWTTMKDTSLLAARVMKFASYLATFIRHILTMLVKGAMHFTTILGPTLQIGFIALSALILLGLFYGIKKRHLIGERP